VLTEKTTHSHVPRPSGRPWRTRKTPAIPTLWTYVTASTPCGRNSSFNDRRIHWAYWGAV
jgi:hypothetical protein